MSLSYRSFAEQTRHYFTRPHRGLPGAPVASPAAWLGSQQRQRENEWLIHLTPVQIDALAHAAEQAMAAGVSQAALTAAEFEIEPLLPLLKDCRRELASGRGFVVLRGLPVAQWGDELAAYVYWGIGHHLGVPGAQNPANELLGHVVDYGEEAAQPSVRRYRTSGNIDFHCDAADVVGLLCLRTARSGGQSRIASSVSLFNALFEQQPALVPRLFEAFYLDRRDEQPAGAAPYSQLQPCCWDGTTLRTFYHSEYFRSASRLAEVTIDSAAQQVLDGYDALAASPEHHLDMWLEPGDMQFISNHTTIHARTAYEDWPDPARRRHLLRLWLSLPV
ncbi:MAG: TauD/TfdA family dioxygenase [Pseudomonadota bacterium]